MNAPSLPVDAVRRRCHWHGCYQERFIGVHHRRFQGFSLPFEFGFLPGKEGAVADQDRLLEGACKEVSNSVARYNRSVPRPLDVSAASPAANSFRDDATVISLVGFAHGTSHFFHFVMPPLFPWLMREFGLSFTQVGAAMTVFFVISSVGQALAGFVVDRIGAFRVLCAGVGLLSLAGLAIASAQNYPMLLAAAAVAGLGNCVFHPADFTLLNRRVSSSRLGHAFSVHGLSGSLGWAAAPVFVLAIAETSGWRAAAVGASIVGFLALAFLFANRRVLRDAQATAAQEPAKREGGTFAFLGVGVVWMCFAFFLLAVMAFGALQNFAPPVLERTYGVSLAFATAGLTAYLLGSAAGMAAGGFFASKGEHQDWLVAVALAAAATCAISLASGAVPAWSVVALMGMMGFGVGFSGPSRDILVRRAATSTFGAAAYGRVYGFVYSGIDVGLALAPLVFGPLMDAGRYTHVLWGVAILQTLAIGAALTVGSRSRTQ
jgi:predicted MFS family arabinose efflux permease